IKQYTIAVKAFGRPTDFNPRSDPIVRIEAGRLRRGLGRYYHLYGSNDPIVIDIPTGAYIPTFKANETVAPASDEASASLPSPAALPQGPAIVVTPFETALNDDAQRYFADGLAEQMVVALNRFHHLPVIGPLRREAIKGDFAVPGMLGRRYQAQFVLSGRIHKFADTVKIMVRLTDTQTGAVVWSDVFDGQTSAAELFLFGEEVTNQIAATLADTYGVIPRAILRRTIHSRSDDFRVFDAVIRYSHFMITGTEEAANQAIGALEQAVTLDPDNAMIKALLADMYSMMYQYGADEATLAQSERLAKQAILLDPQCQHAHFVLAFNPFFRGERERFIREMRQAVRLNPNNAMVLAFAGLHLGTAGEWDEGRELMKKAMILNPHYPGWYHSLNFLMAYRQGNYEEALAEAHKFNRPDLFWDPLIRAATLGQLGRTKEAGAAIRELLALKPDFLSTGRTLMYRALFSDENVDMLLAGLYKAGLDTVA
ncbi:MAG: hypothetical protein D6768_20580, partial [Chloroflexi bacterium]